MQNVMYDVQTLVFTLVGGCGSLITLTKEHALAAAGVATTSVSGAL